MCFMIVVWLLHAFALCSLILFDLYSFWILFVDFIIFGRCSYVSAIFYWVEMKLFYFLSCFFISTAFGWFEFFFISFVMLFNGFDKFALPVTNFIWFSWIFNWFKINYFHFFVGCWLIFMNLCLTFIDVHSVCLILAVCRAGWRSRRRRLQARQGWARGALRQRGHTAWKKRLPEALGDGCRLPR